MYNSKLVKKEDSESEFLSLNDDSSHLTSWVRLRSLHKLCTSDFSFMNWGSEYLLYKLILRISQDNTSV